MQAFHNGSKWLSKEIAVQDSTAAAGVRETPDEMSALEILTTLIRHRGQVFIITGLSFLLGIILCLPNVLPVSYKASVRIMPPQQTPSSAAMLMSQLSSGGSSNALMTAASASIGLKNPNEIYIGLLRARPISDHLIQRFDLMSAYHKPLLSSTREKLAKRTTIESEKSGFICITVVDSDKQRVANIANGYVDALRAFTGSLSSAEAQRRKNFYESQLKEAKDALVKAEIDYQQIQQKTGVVALDMQSRALIEGMATMRAKVASKQVEVEALRSSFTDRSPQLQIAEKELSTMQAELVRMEHGSAAHGASDLAISAVSASGMDFLQAQHEVLYRQTLFDMLIKQYDAARLDEMKEAAVIQVVEPAIPPDKKAAPSKSMILLISLIAGFLIACGVVVGREHLRVHPEALQPLAILMAAFKSR
jgi:uncharacterized protein involved in exopolysaccharide biosynthesis